MTKQTKTDYLCSLYYFINNHLVLFFYLVVVIFFRYVYSLSWSWLLGTVDARPRPLGWSTRCPLVEGRQTPVETVSGRPRTFCSRTNTFNSKRTDRSWLQVVMNSSYKWADGSIGLILIVVLGQSNSCTHMLNRDYSCLVPIFIHVYSCLYRHPHHVVARAEPSTTEETWIQYISLLNFS